MKNIKSVYFLRSLKARLVLGAKSNNTTQMSRKMIKNYEKVEKFEKDSASIIWNILATINPHVFHPIQIISHIHTHAEIVKYQFQFGRYIEIYLKRCKMLKCSQVLHFKWKFWRWICSNFLWFFKSTKKITIRKRREEILMFCRFHINNL